SLQKPLEKSKIVPEKRLNTITLELILDYMLTSYHSKQIVMVVAEAKNDNVKLVNNYWILICTP
ncbi:35124_t:CDS:1, partial [Gigaspora margarita]